jgi:ABC-type oligopeptide transport system substrate-binding subunit
MFREAEERLMEQMPIIPIYTYTSRHLIHAECLRHAAQPHGFAQPQVRVAGPARAPDHSEPCD